MSNLAKNIFFFPVSTVIKNSSMVNNLIYQLVSRQMATVTNKYFLWKLFCYLDNSDCVLRLDFFLSIKDYFTITVLSYKWFDRGEMVGVKSTRKFC